MQEIQHFSRKSEESNDKASSFASGSMTSSVPQNFSCTLNRLSLWHDSIRFEKETKIIMGFEFYEGLMLSTTKHSLQKNSSIFNYNFSSKYGNAAVKDSKQQLIDCKETQTAEGEDPCIR